MFLTYLVPDDPIKSSDTFIDCNFAENSLNFVKVIQILVKSVKYSKPLRKITTSSGACNFSKFVTNISKTT